MKALVPTVFAASLAMALPVAARDTMGVAVVNDTAVRLFDDGTWEYDAELLADGCLLVDAKVQLCDPNGGWKRETGPTFGYDALFANSLNNDIRGAVASQPYGSSVGNSFDGVLAHFVKGAAAADGIAPEMVQILDSMDTEMGGLPARQFVISFPQNGLKQVNAYTIAIQPEISVYALTWAAGEIFTDTMRRAHRDFTQALSIRTGKND